MTRAEVNAIGVMLASLRDPSETVIVVAVAAHGPSHDMPDGSLSATVAEGQHSATAEAKYLFDAIMLARGKLRREAALRAKKAEAAA